MMEIAAYLLPAALAAAALYAILTYNRLVRLRNLTREGWSGIDVQLKRRSNLIPNLVATVKGYAAHESRVLAEVTEARGAAVQARSLAGMQAAEDMLTAALGRLLAVAEAYPDLKADANFRELQGQLAETEDLIEKARRYYNGTVREQNTAVEQFPSNLIAGAFGFAAAEFFEIADPAHRALPEVRF
jgi:LemA protein